MKNIKNLLVLLPLAFTLFAVACKKDNKPKPDTITAKVDGTSWRAGACWSCISAGRGFSTIYLPDQRLNIIGQMVDENINTTIEINVSGIKGVGKYTLGNKGNYTTSYARVSKSNSNISYYTTSSFAGYITITNVNTIESTISGTFEFTASTYTNNTVQVSDGNFILKVESQ